MLLPGCNLLQGQLQDAMTELNREVQKQSVSCVQDMCDFQKRFDVILNIYLGEGTEIRVKRHVAKIKEDIEAYNQKCCDNIRLQADQCNETCGKALRSACT